MTSDAPPRGRIGFGFWSFIALMLALTALFVGLGVWQVQRLAWKENLIAQVSDRMTRPPAPLPAVAQWPGIVADDEQYRPLAASGHYLEDKTVLVFTGLSDARGRYSGPGYWVMSAFAPDGGGTLFVNRGFVPQDRAGDFAAGQGLPAGQASVSGVAAPPDAPGMFTPPPDAANHIEWVRDPARLAAMAGIDGPVFPLTLDAPAGAAGDLPQGGETVVDFPNNHFGYALTWFGFALLTPALLAAWIWRQLRPARTRIVPARGPEA